MHRQKRDPALAAKSIKEQKKLVVRISKITTETKETVAEVAALLDNGVDASARDYNLSLYYASKNYFSPLHYAARKGAIKITELLLKHNADPNAKDRYEVTPLHLAAENGSEACVKRLLEAGADVNAKTRYLKDYQNRYLLDNQPAMALYKVINLPYKGGTTALHLAASNNHINCVRVLMWEGADYNADNADGETSLYLAASKGLEECVMMQLQSAISVPILAIPTNRNDTALHQCLRHGERMKECVQELVRHGSDVSFKNIDGDSPVHVALRYHWDVRIVQLLILKGYNMDFDRKDGNIHGKSPLDIVVYGEPVQMDKRVERDEEMAAFFIKLGASRSLLDILASELRSKEPASDILETTMDSFAYLPPLDTLMGRECRFDRHLRRAFPNAANGSGAASSNRRMKKEAYRERACQVPSLQHLSRCSIRGAMQQRIRKVHCLPIPTHMKEYILLNYRIPEDML